MSQGRLFQQLIDLHFGLLKPILYHQIELLIEGLGTKSVFVKVAKRGVDKGLENLFIAFEYSHCNEAVAALRILSFALLSEDLMGH